MTEHLPTCWLKTDQPGSPETGLRTCTCGADSLPEPPLYSALRIKLSHRLQMDPDTYNMDKLEEVVAGIIAEDALRYFVESCEQNGKEPFTALYDFMYALRGGADLGTWTQEEVDEINRRAKERYEKIKDYIE